MKHVHIFVLSQQKNAICFMLCEKVLSTGSNNLVGNHGNIDEGSGHELHDEKLQKIPLCETRANGKFQLTLYFKRGRKISKSGHFSFAIFNFLLK